MNTSTCVRVQFEIGHEASARSVKTSEGYTHDWEVFVRGVDNAEIHHFIDKVVFHLHASFRNAKRVKKEPPYTVKESGYGGFNLAIDIYLKTKDEHKKLRYYYDLTFPNEGESISNSIKRKADFANPSEDFRRKLIKGGGVGVGALETNKTAEKIHSTTDDAKHSSKSKPSTGPDSKKHKSKDAVKVEEFKTKNSFAELFGTPIKTAAPPPPKLSTKSSSDSGKSTHSTDKQAKDGHNSVKSIKPSPTKEKDGCKKENSVKKDKDGSKEKDKERPSKGDSKVKERDNHKDKESHKNKEKDKSKHVKRSCSPSSRSNPTKEESQKKPEESRDKSSSKVETKVKHKEKRKDKEEKKPHKEEKKDSKDRSGIEKVDHKSICSDHKKSDSSNEKKEFSSEGKTDSKSKSSAKDERKEKMNDKEKEKVENNKHKHKHKKKERHKKDEKEKHKKKHDKVEDSKNEDGSPEPVKTVTPLQLLEHSLSDKDSDTDFSVNDEIIPSERSVSESPPSQIPPAKVKEEKKPTDSKEEKHKRHDKKSKDEKESRKRKKKVRDIEDQPPEKIPKIEPKVEPKVEIIKEEVDERDGIEEESSKSPERSSEVSKSPSPEGNKFTEEYVHQLRELQHKIMSLQDTSYLQKVVEVIAETGQFEITQRTFDFDLCALDRVTVKRLQDMFVTAS